MSYKPIRFSGEMVRAILEGRKTQTRRIVKPQPVRDEVVRGTRYLCQPGWPLLCEREFIERMCRVGQVGDVLWVREEHYRYGQWKKNGVTESGRQKWKFHPDPQFTEIRYFDNPPAVVEKNSHRSTGWYKRLARFMPKSACRLFVEITDIRVERLQDISEEDAMAEGVEQLFPGNAMGYRSYAVFYGGGGVFPYVSFKTLWQKINGPDSWEADPFVWAISFRRIDKPEGFV